VHHLPNNCADSHCHELIYIDGAYEKPPYPFSLCHKRVGAARAMLQNFQRKDFEKIRLYTFLRAFLVISESEKFGKKVFDYWLTPEPIVQAASPIWRV
jgi:hypothetical protein